MIRDGIKEGSKQNPQKIFITISGEKITYEQFDCFVYCIELLIKSQKIFPKIVKIKCLDKKILLSSIVACNRVNSVPVVFPPDDKIVKFLDYDKIVSTDFEIGSTLGGSEFFDTTFLVYALNVIISFILISLFNVQEQIEDPFDQDGMDDIKLENYELDY